eukprot:757724-Hanusia_phi.AAC.1
MREGGRTAHEGLGISAGGSRDAQAQEIVESALVGGEEKHCRKRAGHVWLIGHAGVVARLVCHPIDTIKAKQQVQTGKLRVSFLSVYRSEVRLADLSSSQRSRLALPSSLPLPCRLPLPSPLALPTSLARLCALPHSMLLPGLHRALSRDRSSGGRKLPRSMLVLYHLRADQGK